MNNVTNFIFNFCKFKVTAVILCLFESFRRQITESMKPTNTSVDGGTPGSGNFSDFVSQKLIEFCLFFGPGEIDTKVKQKALYIDG